MAVTKVDIASRALIMMGAQPISSFSDDSTEALVVNNIYEEIIESSLTRYRWRFATGQKQLSLLADAPVGRYSYAYQMPTNPLVLKINAVTVNDYSIPYDRYEDKIYVNDYGSQSTVIMDYIFRQDESQFPPYFRLALEFQLASIFAGSIARDSGMIREFGDRAERQYLIAKNTDSQETTANKLDTNRYLNLRQSTRSAV
jgi:sensor histidine kinase YesM